ncbi:MAG: hypothetical protein LBJ10_07905 [Clostridiales bacterium]|jgi:hypothetical protein|nr:hypothetical protein [Clostridiales bacterium]
MRREARDSAYDAALRAIIANGWLMHDGGPGSGNFGHAGRPGEAGGSAPSGGAGGGKTSGAEKRRKIGSVRIDFSRDNVLPELNKEDLDELGKPSKPVLLKKSVIAKNDAHHPEVPHEAYAEIIGQSLYNPELVVPGSEKSPYFNFISRIGNNKNTVVLLELEETKTNYEIVNLHWSRDRQRKQLERKGNKNK